MAAAATAAAAAVDVAEVVIQDEGVPPEQKALAEETATVSVAAIASLASQLKQDGYCIIPTSVAGHPLDAHELEEESFSVRTGPDQHGPVLNDPYRRMYSLPGCFTRLLAVLLLGRLSWHDIQGNRDQ